MAMLCATPFASAQSKPAASSSKEGRHQDKLSAIHTPYAAGSRFDSTLTMEMQIFGQSVLPFTSAKQGIITDGVARFLGTGVTGSQIVLTVQNTIAGVSKLSSHFRACPAVLIHICRMHWAGHTQ